MMGTDPASATEYRLGHLDEVPLGEGRTFTVDGRWAVVVFRPRGRPPAATDATCPHRGGPLADGLVGDGTVVCPLHAMRFSLADGTCDTDDTCSVAVHPVRVDEDGHIVVMMPGSP